MGKSLTVHVWFDDYDPASAADLFVRSAACIPTVSYQEPDGRNYHRFETLKIERDYVQNVVHEAQLASNDVTDLKAQVEVHVGDRYMYNLGSVYQYNSYDPDSGTLVNDLRPLTLQLFSPGYGVDQYYFRKAGLLVATFCGLDSFLVPPELIRATQQAISSRTEQHLRLMRMIDTVAKNIDVVHGFAQATIEAADPKHLLVCTDWEIHPLTAHGLYHSDFRDFPRDLSWIIALHRQGGLYLQPDIQPNHRLADPPRATSADYGELAEMRGTKQFLQAHVEDFSRRMASPLHLSVETMWNVLDGAAGTTVIPLRESAYIASDDGAFGCLDEFFFLLFERVMTADI